MPQPEGPMTAFNAAPLKFAVARSRIRGPFEPTSTETSLQDNILRLFILAEQAKASILTPMFHPKILSLLALTLFINLSIDALTVDNRGIKNRALFGIEFPGNARSFHAQEKAVLSISKQEYVTAAYRVLEVNIVTDGTALLRVYHSRALRPGEFQRALGDAAKASGLPGSSMIKTPLPPQVEAAAQKGGEVADTISGDTVIKEYPLATHAHTIEFRVSSRSELLELHDQLKKHWLKEPTYFEGGQIVEPGERTRSEMKPRSLGGTLFKVEK